MKTTVHSLSLLCHNLGIVHQISQWYLTIGANFSPHQILPFQISHVPTPPPPGILDGVCALSFEKWWRRGEMGAVV